VIKIGIDLGGTNLRAAVVGEGATLIDSHKEPVGEARDPESITERCASVVENLVASTRSDERVSVGVGIAAMLRGRQGTVANSPHLRWRDVPFGQLLARRLGNRYAVGVYNDVNAIVYGEGIAGAARGCNDVLGVYVGTGIGGGLIVNGQLVEGATNCAGEIGHTKIRWDDTAAPCACGSRGCIEAYVGGSYLLARIRKELAAGARSSAVALAGGVEHVNPGHIDEAAANGDDYALALWTELAPLLGVSLANAVAVLNPAMLVLGGGLLGRTQTLYDMVVATMMVAGTQASLEALRVAPAELADDAGLVGSAHLAERAVSIVTR
jgi:glucokinase